MRKTKSKIAKEKTRFPALLEFLGRKRMVKRFPIIPTLETKIRIIPTHLSNDKTCSNSFILSSNITTDLIIIDIKIKRREKGKTCIFLLYSWMICHRDKLTLFCKLWEKQNAPLMSSNIIRISFSREMCAWMIIKNFTSLIKLEFVVWYLV